VLLFATGIGEAEVDELDLVFLDELEYIGDGLCHQFLLSWMVVWKYRDGDADSVPLSPLSNGGS
jgi:hypothetical protein